MSKTLKRLFQTLVILALTLVLLEVALQVLSFGRHVLYQKNRSKADVAVTQGVDTESLTHIICAGDSYTFGMGASDGDHSYPGQLEKLLAGRATVATAAFPGQDSRQALMSLEAKIREQSPEIVVFMAGINDFHNRPEALTLSELTDSDLSAPNKSLPSEGFRWEWRTAKVLRLARHRGAFADSRSDQEDTPLVADSETAVPDEPDSELLALPPVERLAKSWQLYWTRDFKRAAAGFASLNSPEFEWQRRAAEIALSGEAGDRERHDQLLDQLWVDLEADHEQPELASDAHVCAMVFRRIADQKRGVPLAQRFTTRFPDNHNLHSEAMLIHHFAKQPNKAKYHSDRTVELRPEPGPDSYKWEMRGQIYGALGDAATTADAALNAYLASRNEHAAKLLMSIFSDLITPSVWAEAIDRRVENGGLPEGTEEILRNIGKAPEPEPQPATKVVTEADTPAPENPIKAVARAHYQLLLTRCREINATPVLLAYPLKKEKISGLMREVAEAEGVLFIDLSEAIDAELKKGKQWDDLFIGDGHCNDAGYRACAEWIARKIDALIK